MSAILVPRSTFRGTLWAIAFGIFGMVFQAACGGNHASTPPAEINSFKASPGIITAGQGAVLNFYFSGSGSIDQGVGPVTSGQAITVTPTADTTYTLTTVNTAGAPVTATATVSVKTFTGKFVYVANAGGGVSGFALNDATGALTELANSPYDETAKALHVTSDPSGKFLFVVNGDGAVDLDQFTVYSINSTTGDLTVLNSYSTGTDPWATTVDPTGRFVYVRSDGSISGFTLNATTGQLTPTSPASISTAAGAGELVIHPSGQFLYTVGRTSNQVQGFTINPATGALAANGTPFNLPAGTGPLSLALNNTGEYLYTKSEGVAGGDALACILYGFRVNVTTGSLAAMPAFDTGLLSSDTYHGVSANPAKPIIYITLYNSDSDHSAYTMNLATGALTAIAGAPYNLFGGTGSDSLVVSRNGKWGFAVDYNGGQIVAGSVDATTGLLTGPKYYDTGLFPVSVAVVGTVQ